MKYLILVLFCLFFYAAKSQTVTWIGGGAAHEWFDEDNWDTGFVPCVTCDVIIENDSVVYSEKDEVIRSLEIDNAGILTVLSGRLTVDANNNLSVTQGVTVKTGCKLYNIGILNIQNSYSNAMRLYSLSYVENKGSIGIDHNTQDNGILSSGTLYNIHDATIKIDNIDEESYYNYGTLNNEGELLISESFSSGVYNFGTINNTKQGLIYVHDIYQHGIWNNGLFNNESSCEIDLISQIGVISATGITNGDTLFNSGTITISNIEGEGISTFGSLGTTINDNQMIISDVTKNGLNVDNYLRNNGTVDIQRAENGIELRDTLENYGDLLISDIGKSGIETVFSADFFKNFNKAKISINGSLESGIHNKSTFQNFGEIEIMNVTNTGWSGIHNEATSVSSLVKFFNHGELNISACFNGIRNEGYANTIFENTKGGVVDIDNTTFYGIKNTRKFSNSGVLNVSNTMQNAIENSGPDTSYNYGTINIVNSSKIGLKNSATLFINKTGSTIAIDSTLEDGLYNSNGFTNFGDLEIGVSSKNGLNNFGGDFTNSSNIKVRQTMEAGIRNRGSSGLFLNEDVGIIRIDTAKTNGLYNTAKFKNDGIAIFVYSDGSGVLNFENEDTLFNTGDFYIYDAQTMGFENSGSSSSVVWNEAGSNINVYNSIGSGFYTTKKVINDGKLRISGSMTATGFVNMNNADSLINNSVIEVWYSNEDAILNSGNGSVLINNSSPARINTLFTEGIGFKNTDRFENYGSFYIRDNKGTGLLNFENSDTLINEGLIRIYDNDSLGLENHGVGSVFLNDEAGEIEIYNMREGVKTSKKFINKGEIEIRDLSNICLINSANSDSLLNYGIIKIMDSDTIGVENVGSGSVFVNESGGWLSIENMGNVSLHSQQVFVNNGRIDILGGNSPHALSNDQSMAFFYNYGELYTNGLHGINNSFSSFYNGHCGKININEGILIINAALAGFVNDGLIEQYNYAGTNPINGFENNGVFVFQSSNQSFNGTPVNNGMLVRAPLGGLSTGIKEMGLVEAGNSPNFGISNTWWANPTKTSIAGDYAISDLSFTPNQNGVSADSLYFEIDNGTCVLTTEMPIISGPYCGGQSLTATFTQAVSTDWHNPENWDLGFVPNPCTTAIIPSSKSCTISSGRKARALKILSEMGSVFDAELGVVLETTLE